MNNLEKLLAKVFSSICSEIDGNTEHISEDIKTSEIIKICEEYKLTDLKDKLVNLENAYDDCDYDEVNNRITLDSMEIAGLADDVPYIFKVYTLDIDNNKSIADSVVLQPMSLAACKAIVGPQVESTVSSASGVDSVIISIRDLRENTFCSVKLEINIRIGELTVPD